MKEFREILARYLPENSVDQAYNLLEMYKVHLRITRKRSSKLGDFRPSGGRGIHRISVNHDLNRYAFLITLVHEVAHVAVWAGSGSGVKPHGREWKSAYCMLMRPFLGCGIFPGDVETALNKYLENAKASSGADVNLTKALRKYDNKNHTTLEDLEENTLFRIENGKTFRKQTRVRTRYRCLCIEDRRVYLVHPLVKVFPL